MSKLEFIDISQWNCVVNSSQNTEGENTALIMLTEKELCALPQIVGQLIMNYTVTLWQHKTNPKLYLYEYNIVPIAELNNKLEKCKTKTWEAW